MPPGDKALANGRCIRENATMEPAESNLSKTQQDAAAAISRQLNKPAEFARFISEGLTNSEADQAARQLDRPNGAVALAAIIYKSLNRLGRHELAESCAIQDFEIISRTVLIRLGNKMKRRK